MSFDFDKVVDRRNTLSEKYDFAVERGKPADVLPFWVADMDFPVAPCIHDALIKAVNHGIFGYSEVKKPYFDALHHWYQTYFGWDVKENWLVKTPGVVYALCAAIRGLTKEGDAILIQQPVYYPFMNSIKANKRKLVNSPLVEKDGRYFMDFEDMEKKIAENHVKLAILCSPHNPVGRVWTEDELHRYSAICRKYGVTVVSDEIHSDFVYPGHKHTVFASLGDYEEQHSIVCTAPSKTFNIAGLQISDIWIPNDSLRRAVEGAIVRAGTDEMNLLGLVAAYAAYTGGREWLDAMRAYLKDNLDFTRDYLKQYAPKVKLVEPDGTYLLWLDFRAFGLSAHDLQYKMEHEAKLWLDMGDMFGEEGAGFARINLACPRATLTKGLARIRQAFGN